jgi:hypothetical protein
VNLALVAGFAPSSTPTVYAVAQSAAFLAVLVVTGVAALRTLPVPPSLRDCACVVLAVGLMIAALWPLYGLFAAPIELALQVTLGMAIYGATLLACDVMHCRRGLLFWWSTRRIGRG